MARRGDVVTVFAVDTFSAAAIIVSLADFFVLRGRSIYQVDPLGVAVFLVGIAVEGSALRALKGQYSQRVKTNENQTLVQAGP